MQSMYDKKLTSSIYIYFHYIIGLDKPVEIQNKSSKRYMLVWIEVFKLQKIHV